MDELEGAVNGLQVRVAIVEKLLNEHEARINIQLGRILSDIESEKGTRQRLHADWKSETDALNRRLLSLEKHVSVGIGIIVALQFVIPIVTHLFKP